MSLVRPLIVMGFSSPLIKMVVQKSGLCKAAISTRSDPIQTAIWTPGVRNPNSFCIDLVEQMRKTSQRQRITLGSQPRDYAVGAKRYIGVVAEFLALVDVRDVNFDDRRFEGIQRVEDRNRRMRECGRIDHDATCNFPCLVNPVDDLVFTVRLVKAKVKSKLSGDLAAIGLDSGKSFVTVDVGLAFAEQIQVGTVQHVDDTVHVGLRDQSCLMGQQRDKIVNFSKRRNCADRSHTNVDDLSLQQPQFLEYRGGLLDRVVGGRHAAIDRLLQQYFLDIVGREAALGKGCADVKAELVPLSERDHSPDHQHTPGAMIEMRPGPDFAPGMARDQIDEIGVERILARDRFIDPGVAQHLAALSHTVVAAFSVIHGWPRIQCSVRKPITASVKACGCSTLEICAASRIVREALGIWLRMNSPAATGVAVS